MSEIGHYNIYFVIYSKYFSHNLELDEKFFKSLITTNRLDQNKRSLMRRRLYLKNDLKELVEKIESRCNFCN